ncbi:MAG: TadE/TadG family type IV pilus assembly protein [Gemmatimonadota bacterium]
MNRLRGRDVPRVVRRILRDESGQDLAETAIILPFLLVLALGVVEFGSVFGTSHTLTSLGREGANIAARGAPLDTVNALMLENGAEINLMSHGGSITSRIVVQDSVPTIAAQGATDTYAGRSRLGNPGEPAAGLSSLAGAEGASFYVVELFYVYDDRTPLGSILKTSVPDTLYTRAVF